MKCKIKISEHILQDRVPLGDHLSSPLTCLVDAVITVTMPWRQSTWVQILA